MASITVLVCDHCGVEMQDASFRDWGTNDKIRVSVLPRMEIGGGATGRADLCKSCYANFAEEAARLIREWADA